MIELEATKWGTGSAIPGATVLCLEGQGQMESLIPIIPVAF
jgi:hypothetical protein